MLSIDPEEIRRALDLLAAGEERVFELRMPKVRTPSRSFPVVMSGYFDDHEKLVAALVQCETRGIHPESTYISLNPVNPALLARAANRLRIIGKDDPLTKDCDVVRLRWLPLDFDPVRPSHISSTDKEHNLAIERAREVREHLRALGWPDPALADSGSGGHLLYPVDLPVERAGLVKRCLQALAARFTDRFVNVDQTVFTLARIWKLYGTVARKGEDLAERPHRIARVMEAGHAANCPS